MRVVQRHPSFGYIDNWLWVPKQYLNVEGTKSALSFSFADSYDSDNVRVVNLWKETANHLLVPRAFWDPKELPFKVIDLRPTRYEHVEIRSKINLDYGWREENGKMQLLPTGKSVQKNSFEALLRSPGGVLQLACGKGKTCVALSLIAYCSGPALIVLPDTQLMEQWRKEIANLIEVPEGVGLIQADKFDWKKPIVLTTYHTIGARAPYLPEEVRSYYCIVCWDEGHHITAPTFAPSAEVFYGKRIMLTATPERDDGLHIIAEYHVGPVVYKDLQQDLKPRIIFRWSDLEVDESKHDVQIRARNGEIHISLLSSYFAIWTERLAEVLCDTRDAIAAGRKVLFLSNSEAEIINMATLYEDQCWDGVPKRPLYTDIPIPTPADVGETLSPVELSDDELERLSTIFNATTERLHSGMQMTANVRQQLETQQAEASLALKQHEVHLKVMRELKRRQANYVKDLTPTLTKCGIMIHKVKPTLRQSYVDNMPVVFAIMKYGKEGLDSPALDTVQVSMPFSSHNSLQQLMGRPTRNYPNKRTPLIIIYECGVGQVMGMCDKLRKHLREWSHEEGGPFDYEKVGHPKSRRGTWNENKKAIFGQ